LFEVQVARAAEAAQERAEEDQAAELLRQGGTIARRAVEDRATLEGLIRLKQRLQNGKHKPGKPLFNLDRW
jgi:translation elongation factor EF-Ts